MTLQLVIVVLAALVAHSSPGDGGSSSGRSASLTGSVRETQVTHQGAGEDGEGVARVGLASLVAARLSLPMTAGQRRVSIPVRGSGDAHARFVLAERPGMDSRNAECASPVKLMSRVTVTFVARPGGVRIRLALPFLRAPYVEASDLYPASGPCEEQLRTLTVERSFPAALVGRPRVSLMFAGKRMIREGDIARTITWAVRLSLVQR